MASGNVSLAAISVRLINAFTVAPKLAQSALYHHVAAKNKYKLNTLLVFFYNSAKSVDQYSCVGGFVLWRQF